MRASPNHPSDESSARGIASAFLENGQIKFRRADPHLRPYVGCFWIIEVGARCRVRTIPDLCAAISVELFTAGPPRVTIIKPALRSRTRCLRPGSRVVGVRLKPGTIRLLRGPFPATLERVRREVSLALRMHTGGSSDPEVWLAALRIVLEHRVAGRGLDPIVARALGDMTRRSTRTSVAAIAARAGISERQLRRIFRAWVGVSPKQALRIARFQSTLGRIASRPTATAHVAADAGYFDQSHLARDAGLLVQATPGQLAIRRVADFSKTICPDGPIVSE